MAKLYPVTLYYNTGFDRGNIPDSPALLAPFEKKTFAPVFLRQNIGVASIRINATWQDVANADYVSIEEPDRTAYYVLANTPVVLNDATVELSLISDDLNTYGGANAITEIVSGWAVRAHPSDDTIFANCLPEDFNPTQELKVVAYETIHKPVNNENHYQDMTAIAIATADLSVSENFRAMVAKSSDDVGTEGLSVVVPEAPGAYAPTGETPLFDAINGTIFAMETTRTGDAGWRQYLAPRIYAFRLSNPRVTKGIAACRNLGIESNILAMYNVPSDDVTVELAGHVSEGGAYPDLDDARGIIGSLKGKRHIYPSTMPYEYYTPKNKKVLALYNTYVVTSVSSGNSIEFKAAELYAGGKSPDWFVTSDPSPEGTTYCGPTYWEGRETHNLEQTVAGLPWLNAGVSYTEGSGSGLEVLQAARKNRVLDYNENVAAARDLMETGRLTASTAIDAGMGGVKVAGGLVTAAMTGGIWGIQQAGEGAMQMAGAGANAAYGLASLELDREARKNQYVTQLGENLFSANVAARVVAPQLAFPISVNAAAYFGNAFAVMHIGLQENDLKRFDDFLSSYGYRVDAKFIKSMLSNRTNHNYIKTTGAQIKINAPRYARERIQAMLDAGVRIWHVAPSQAALIDNPIKG